MFKLFVLCAVLGFVAAVSPLSSGQYRPDKPLRPTRLPVYGEPLKYDDIKVEYKSDVRADGFEHFLDTSNGIHHAATGEANGLIRGEYSWIAPGGEKISVAYVADENGYRPSGEFLPTPPPMPVAILKALEYLKAHPYKEEKY